MHLEIFLSSRYGQHFPKDQICSFKAILSSEVSMKLLTLSFLLSISTNLFSQTFEEKCSAVGGTYNGSACQCADGVFRYPDQCPKGTAKKPSGPTKEKCQASCDNSYNVCLGTILVQYGNECENRNKACLAPCKDLPSVPEVEEETTEQTTGVCKKVDAKITFGGMVVKADKSRNALVTITEGNCDYIIDDDDGQALFSVAVLGLKDDLVRSGKIGNDSFVFPKKYTDMLRTSRDLMTASIGVLKKADMPDLADEMLDRTSKVEAILKKAEGGTNLSKADFVSLASLVKRFATPVVIGGSKYPTQYKRSKKCTPPEPQEGEKLTRTLAGLFFTGEDPFKGSRSIDEALAYKKPENVGGGKCFSFDATGLEYNSSVTEERKPTATRQ